MGGINIEISDKELFELLGKKDCEIAMNEKNIEIFKAQFEKVKGIMLENESLKKSNIELEASNKNLSDKNIELDKALTESRKERDSLETENREAKDNIVALELKKTKKKKKSKK